MIRIKKGLDVPIIGTPKRVLAQAKPVETVAILGDDYVGMRPTVFVEVGAQVKKGQKLLEDKKIPGVFFTSPVAGRVKEINRGERRAFQSIVIEVTGDEQVSFASFKKKALDQLSSDEAQALLIESGLWTALRTRPFSKTPAPGSKPRSIFVNVMDTHPLAVDPELAIEGHEESFRDGLKVLARLTEGSVFVVTRPQTKLKVSDLPKVRHETFAGVHPAGNVGTHIHFLDPVSATKTVWHLGAQDVVAIGKLFLTGQLFTRRVVALGGPMVKEPRCLETVLGANLTELTAGQCVDGKELRVISGSILCGRHAAGPVQYLGRFHQQVSVLEEGRKREFLGWQMPGLSKFSFKSAFVSKLIPGKRFALNTNENGSHRSIVPIGSYEGVLPLDILATPLLRMLMARNSEVAQALGALELDEEDLALCTMVDPCKNDFGPALRENLTLIEREG